METQKDAVAYTKGDIAVHTDFAKLIARLNVKQLYMLRNMCSIGIEMRLDDSEDNNTH